MKQIHKPKDETGNILTPNDFLRWKEVNIAQIQLYTDNKEKTGNDLWGILPSSLSKDEVENDYSKELLRESLLKDQFYLCCYCNDTIKGEPLDTKVEHFLPKETYKEKAFEYENLFAACNGGERVKPVELSCDSIKGYKDPTERETEIISPLEKDVHLHFSYKENGEIFHATETGKNTIKHLNLNCKRLVFRRKAVIEEYIYDEEIEIEELIEEALMPINGKLQAFCMAIVNVLENYR